MLLKKWGLYNAIEGTKLGSLKYNHFHLVGLGWLKNCYTNVSQICFSIPL